MRTFLTSWRVWATAYLAVVGMTSTLNFLSAPDSAGWYEATYLLTLPLSPFAVLFIGPAIGQFSVLTGGDYLAGNAYGFAAGVLAFVALAVINVAVLRILYLAARGAAAPRSGLTAQSGPARWWCLLPR